MDEYEYDVEFTNAETEYMTSDLLVASEEKPQIMTMKNEQAVESLVKKYEGQGDVEYTMSKDIEPDHYQTMASDKKNQDYTTTTATPVAPSVQNLTAKPSMKKPLLIGGAAVLALWLFNRD